MASRPAEILRNSQTYSDNRDYVLIRFSPSGILLATAIISEIAGPFAALVIDKDEVTLVMPSELVGEFGRRIPHDAISEIRYRLLTFDVVLDPNLVGFMAYVSRILADANVSILPFAAFSRDHLLIPIDQFDQAMDALARNKGRLS